MRWQRRADIHENIAESLIALIGDPDFVCRHRRCDKDFTRECRLTFSTVVGFLLNLNKGSLQDELDNYFAVVRADEVPERVVTKAAFSAARRKLDYTAFIELQETLLRNCDRDLAVARWQGLDLRTIDGSMLRLPATPEVIARFGPLEEGARCAQGRALFVFDPLTQLIRDAVLAPARSDERGLLIAVLGALKAGDLLLLDRGFPALWLFALLQARRIDWCARVEMANWPAVRDFLASGRDQAVVRLDHNPESRKTCQALGVSARPVAVRLIRVELDSGEIEVLITSLSDHDQYPHHLFKGLYHLRWGIEENIKHLKSRVTIENWSGKSDISVLQDFHARILSANLTYAVALSAQELVDQKHAQDRHPKKVNLTQALSHMKDALVRLLNHANPVILLRKLIALFARTVEPVRPNRRYPRRQGPRLQGHHMNYKPCR